MQIPIIEFDFNPNWPQPVNTGAVPGSPPFQYYSVAKQFQPFLITLFTLYLFFFTLV